MLDGVDAGHEQRIDLPRASREVLSAVMRRPQLAITSGAKKWSRLRPDRLEAIRDLSGYAFPTRRRKLKRPYQVEDLDAGP